jgi:two-component system chemotaxis response regulator CheY
MSDAQAGSAPRALVIDDSRAARTMVGNMMNQLGFDVLKAEHGEAALALLDPETPPTAIIVDWNMPVMDGVEFARALRAIDAFRTVPVLMISSESDPRRVASALLAGIDEYLFKPVNTEMIRERLETMGVYTQVAG